MFFSQNRDELRQMFIDSWRKFREDQPMQPLEQLIAQAIKAHPEYHALFDDPQALHDKDYTPEMGQSNPFLHLGLHIAVQEQIAADRPAGIRALYQTLAARSGDAHDTDHRVAECMAEAIWTAQRNNALPDEAAYLECLKKQV